MSIEDQTDAFFATDNRADGDDGIPRDGYGRYILPKISDGTEGHWSRASTVAKTLEDTHGLTKWRVRMALQGLAVRPDLAALVATANGDKRIVGEVAEKAHVVAAGDAAANNGTAMHAAIVNALKLPHDQPYEGPFAREVAAVRRLLAECGVQIYPQWAERTVLSEAHEVAGTADHLATIGGTGPFIGLDVKTGRDLSYSWLAFAIQLAIYTSATHARNFTDGLWEQLPPIRQDFALILHITPGSDVAQLYVIDLRVGRQGLELAKAVREIRKVKGIAQPFVPGAIAAAQMAHHPTSVPSLQLTPQVLADVLSGATQAALTTQAQAAAAIGADQPVQTALTAPGAVIGEAVVRPPVQQTMPDGTPGHWVQADGGWSLQPSVTVPVGTEHAAAPQQAAPVANADRTKADAYSYTDPAEAAEFERLVKLTKDALAVEAARYGITNVRRYKSKVAAEIIAAQRQDRAVAEADGGNVTTAQLLEADRLAQAEVRAQEYTAADMPAAAAATTLPDHPVFAQQPVGNPFGAQPPQPAAPSDPSTAAYWLAEIAAATSRTALAEVWQRCQNGGHGNVWTQEHNDAGQARLQALGA